MGRKPREAKNTEQKILEIDNRIATKEAELKELKRERKKLEAILKQEKIDALLESIKEKGLTLDSAKEIIDNMN